MIVLVLGPLGSGKSTLVRRIMKPRSWQKVYQAGHLPSAYVSGDLTVVGNYERDSKTRHGLCFLERDTAGFKLALKLAENAATPVLMEGNTKKLDRWKELKFAERIHVVYLECDSVMQGRLGRDVTDLGAEEFEVRQVRTAATIKELGGSVEFVDTRELALARVCECLGIAIPNDPVEEDYR